jgi:hypothetical protein
MTEETIVGVAPVHAPTKPTRVFGSEAEAALRERHLKASGESLYYTFRGVNYEILTPMPAAFMVHAGSIQDGDNTDMREFVAAIKSAFVGNDGNKFVDALLDTNVDIPADAEFIAEVLGDIVAAVSDRPPTK